MISFKLELANKIRDGRAVGNLWGVGRYVDGRRTYWALAPQGSREVAVAFMERATAETIEVRS